MLPLWRDAFVAYFITGRANNGGTEATNGIIELHRRLACGYRNYDNYRLRMLLAAGSLTPGPTECPKSRLSARPRAGSCDVHVPRPGVGGRHVLHVACIAVLDRGAEAVLGLDEPGCGPVPSRTGGPLATEGGL